MSRDGIERMHGGWGVGEKNEASTYKFERQHFRTGRRIAPNFGTHVPIDTLTLIGYKNLTHPTPGGV